MWLVLGSAQYDLSSLYRLYRLIVSSEAHMSEVGTLRLSPSVEQFFSKWVTGLKVKMLFGWYWIFHRRELISSIVSFCARNEFSNDKSITVAHQICCDFNESNCMFKNLMSIWEPRTTGKCGLVRLEASKRGRRTKQKLPRLKNKKNWLESSHCIRFSCISSHYILFHSNSKFYLIIITLFFTQFHLFMVLHTLTQHKKEIQR